MDGVAEIVSGGKADGAPAGVGGGLDGAIDSGRVDGVAIAGGAELPADVVNGGSLYAARLRGLAASAPCSGRVAPAIPAPERRRKSRRCDGSFMRTSVDQVFQFLSQSVSSSRQSR